MAFIPKEIPVWAIDGVNKIFTLSKNIDQLDDVFVDWAIYTDISITWGNQITLSDAPTVSIFVDYYDTPPLNPSNGFLLVSDLRNILERYLDDDLPEVTDEIFLDFANDLQIDLYDRLVDINWLDFVKSQDFIYSTDTIALNTDFLNASKLNTGLYRVQDWKTDIHYPNVGKWSSLKGWYINWTDLKLVWNFSNETLRFNYIPTSYDLNNTTDSTIIPNNRRYYPAVRNMLKMLYSWWSAVDNTDEARSGEKYNQDLQNLVNYIWKTPDSINLDEI